MSALEKIISDARRLVSRLREQDEAADHLVSNAQAMFNRVEAMKQYEEDVGALNALAQHRSRARLVLDIAHESRQLRELRAENSDLRACLEEHQSALELIMSKYRQHMGDFMEHQRRQESEARQQSARLEYAMGGGKAASLDASGDPFMESLSGNHWRDGVHIDKICEMAAIMQKAIVTDEGAAASEQERMARLETENDELRKLLMINRRYGVPLLLDDGDAGFPENGAATNGDRTPTPTNEGPGSVLQDSLVHSFSGGANDNDNDVKDGEDLEDSSHVSSSDIPATVQMLDDFLAAAEGEVLSSLSELAPNDDDAPRPIS